MQLIELVHIFFLHTFSVSHIINIVNLTFLRLETESQKCNKLYSTRGTVFRKFIITILFSDSLAVNYQLCGAGLPVDRICIYHSGKLKTTLNFLGLQVDNVNGKQAATAWIAIVTREKMWC